MRLACEPAITATLALTLTNTVAVLGGSVAHRLDDDSLRQSEVRGRVHRGSRPRSLVMSQSHGCEKLTLRQTWCCCYSYMKLLANSLCREELRGACVRRVPERECALTPTHVLLATAC